MELFTHGTKRLHISTNIRDSHKMWLAEVFFWAFGYMFPEAYKASFAK